MQLADMHQKAHRPAQAVTVLRKLLDAEPDNVRVQARLAELSVATGQPADAVAALRTAAQQLHRRGDHAEAVKYAERALKIDSGDGATQALRARALAAAGQRKEAIAALKGFPNVEAGGEAAGLLLDLYVEAGEAGRACELAGKIFAREPKQYALVHRVAGSLLESGQTESALPLLEMIRGAMLEAGEQERLSQLLVRAAEALPGGVEPREWLVELYRHTSDSFHLPDALMKLAEAYEGAARWEPALQIYSQILEREPENETIRHRRDRVQTQLGRGGATMSTSAPAATQAADSPAAPAVPDQGLDEETQLFVSQALTDVDLYSSYGLTQKAMDLLEVILQRAPGHTVALERLLDLHLGLGNEARTVELAAQLEQIYAELGDKAAADRFSDLRRRFERAVAQAPQESAPAAVPAPAAPAPMPMEFSIPTVDAEPEPEPAPMEPPAAGVISESAVHEVDLSEEWAALAGQVSGSTPSVPAEATVASSSSGSQASDADPEPEGVELLAEYGLAGDDGVASEGSETPPENADDFLRSLSTEFDSLLTTPAAEETSETAQPADVVAPTDGNRARPAAPSTEGLGSRGPLGDVFEEFRAEMGESSETEDLETHYNLGVAYREMGLIEEAISEFQRVAKAHQRGKPFPYAMQCYTLLGLAFMEKRQPSIAATWYERALEIPGLDPETVLALRYDLGVAQEMAGDMKAAHKSFSQVYGMNIDYRDVAERLAALGRTS
jgi:tetratricopeptide (TPR) repeat protein